MKYYHVYDITQGYPGKKRYRLACSGIARTVPSTWRWVCDIEVAPTGLIHPYRGKPVEHLPEWWGSSHMGLVTEGTGYTSRPRDFWMIDGKKDEKP